MKIAPFAIVLLFTGCAAQVPQVAGNAPVTQCKSIGGLPDAVCTPGAIRTTDIKSICHDRTAQYRPSVEYTSKLKVTMMRLYQIQGSPSTVELDHLISLELGGAGSDPKNLWPEPWNGQYGAKVKDAVEDRTHALVCSGKMSVADAQAKIAHDWVALGKEEGIIK